MTDIRQPRRGGAEEAAPAIRRKRNFAQGAATRDAYAAVFGIDSAAILKRKAAAADVATAVAAATTPMSPVLIPGAAPLRPKWSDGVAVKRTFKGDPGGGKIVSLVNVGGQDFVLKTAPRLGPDQNDSNDRSTTEDNAEAAQLFRKLNLKGVRAPDIRIVKGAERDDMMAALQALADGGGKGSLEASNMIAALKDGDVQLSSMDTGGINVDQVFQGARDSAATKGALAIRQSGAGDPDKAWIEALSAAVASWKSIGSNNDLKSSDPAVRRKGLTREIAMNPPDWTKPYLTILEDILDGRQAEGLKKAEDDALQLQINQDKLRAFTKSPEGMAAYAGIAVTDLVTGMFDRMADQWNGGNFLFDPTSSEFCCVDNNKMPSQGLSEDDPLEWNRLLFKAAGSSSGSLSDNMFTKVYEEDENDLAKVPNRPANMPGVTLSDQEKAQGKAIFADTLQSVMSTIENDPAVNPAAKKRVAAMKEFMVMQDILVVPNHVRCPGATPEPTAANKVLRGIKSIGSDWFGDADKIKNDLRRDPTGYRQARAALDALIAKHKNAKDGSDRLAVHIRFLATACEFAQTIGDRGAALGALGTMKFPADPNLTNSFDKMTGRFLSEAKLWKKNLKGSDGVITNAISIGEATYVAACAAFKTKVFI